MCFGFFYVIFEKTWASNLRKADGTTPIKRF